MSVELVSTAPHAAIAALMEALDMPDVTAMLDVENLDTDSRVEFAHLMGLAIAKARALVDEALSPAVQATAKARALIQAEIVKNGGKALPHATFDVRIEQTEQAEKRIDILRTLEGKLPDDQFRKAVYIKTVNVKTVDPTLLKPVIDAGGKPEWDADMTKLNKHAKDFGPESEIGKIIAAGAPRVVVGAPRLVITPRESALKAVQ